MIKKAVLSKHHLHEYKIVKNPTIIQILTHNITGCVFTRGRRAKKNVERMLNYLIFDHDGSRAGFDLFITSLEQANLSYLAFPSPSHKNSLPYAYKMRIIVPAKNLTKELYPFQWLDLYARIGIEVPEGADESAQEIARFFYPPVMKGVTGTPENKKPRNQSLRYALKRVRRYKGASYIAKKAYRASRKQELVPSGSINALGKFEFSKCDSIYFPDDTLLTHKGAEHTYAALAKFARKTGRQVRVTCPFGDEWGEHSDGGKDYAFINSLGYIKCVSSKRHQHLIGRPEGEDPVSLFVEVEDYGEL